MNKLWRFFQSARLIALGILAAACGLAPPALGGVDSGGTGARMQSYSRGTVYGLGSGSVVVNSVSFDDSSAVIVDDEGAIRSWADLKLGMSVDVDGGPVFSDYATGANAAVAHTLRIGSSIRGPVQAVDAAASTMTVFGQTVSVNHSTVFDGLANGLASVLVGQVVEVHASLDTTRGRYVATRVQPKPQATSFKLRGVVSRLDAAARSFSIGQTRIGYSGVAGAGTPVLANGVVAMVQLPTGAVNGVWPAQKLRVGVEAIPEEAGADVDGIVSQYAGLTSFKLNGEAVNAAAWNVIFKNGTSGQIANGVRVIVSGYMSQGVLIANQVEFKSTGLQTDVDVIALHGLVESVNPSARRFVIRGSAVSYDDKTKFVHGVPAGIAVGTEVDISGVLNAAGTGVQAGKIRFGK